MNGDLWRPAAAWRQGALRNALWVSVVLVTGAALGASAYWQHLATLVLVYGWLAIALDFYLLAGLLDLGFIAFFAVAAYAVLIARGAGVSAFVAVPVAVSLNGALAWVLARAAGRSRGDYFAVITLAFGEVVRLTIRNEARWTGGAQGKSMPIDDALSAWLGAAPLRGLLIAGGCVAVLGWVAHRHNHGRSGLQAWLANTTPTFLQANGVSPRRPRLVAAWSGAAIASAAGFFFAFWQGFASPESFSFWESIVVLVIAFLGGGTSGYVGGLLLSALFCVALPELLKVTQEWRMLFFGAGLTLVAVLRPNGVFGLAWWKLDQVEPAGARSRRLDISRSPRRSAAGPEGTVGAGCNHAVEPPSPRHAPGGEEAPRAENREGGNWGTGTLVRGAHRLADVTGGHRMDGIEQTAAALVVSELRAWYPGVDRPIVDGLSFRFDGGRVHAIMGFNGSGKTTLLRAMAGVSPLERIEGTVRFLGPGQAEDVTRPRPFIDRPASRLVGILAQHGGYSASLSPLQHARAIAGSAIVPRMVELCRRWGLDLHVLEAPMGELAQIDRSIALLALMAARDARVLLLDEPTAGTDADRDAPRFYDALRSLVAPDRVVVVVEHHPVVVQRFADQVVFMEGGRIPRAALPATARTSTPSGLVRAPGGDILVAGSFEAVARQPQVLPYLQDAARAAASSEPAATRRGAESGATLRPRNFARLPGPRAARGGIAPLAQEAGNAVVGVGSDGGDSATLLEVVVEEAGYARGAPVVGGMSWRLTTAHSVACLVGPNGTGKTTALRAVCGRIGLGHARGRALWHAQPQAPAVDLVAVLPWRLRGHGVFALLGDGGTFPTLSALDAARLALARDQWGAVERALLALFERFAPVFESSSGLRSMSPEGWMRLPTEVFSGGQRRVAAFASVLAAAQCWLQASTRRALLVLDEPSAGVQPAGVEALYGVLARLLEQWQERLGVVIAEQRLVPVERALGAVALVGTTGAGPFAARERTADG